MLKGWVSYWMIPLFSAVVWLAMLLAMLIFWLTTGKPIYSTMVNRAEGGAEIPHIPYISDVGHSTLKPLFIAMGTVTVVSFDIVFIAERWLRHKGRLAVFTSITQKLLALGGVVFAIAGAVGLILLTIFDNKNHGTTHGICLGIFIGGYVISAIFVCVEYQRLGSHFRQFRILRISFWMKLFFIVVEIALAIAFGVLGRERHYNAAAVMEWVVALVYSVYVCSYIIDFIPAAYSNPGDTRHPMTMDEVAMNGTNGNHASYGYPADRSLGQAVRDTTDMTAADYHNAQHHNGVAATNGYKTRNGAANF